MSAWKTNRPIDAAEESLMSTTPSPRPASPDPAERIRRRLRGAPRWVAIAAMVFLVLLASGAWWIAHRQFFATWSISAAGGRVDWDLSEGRWKRGGTSSVTFRGGGWNTQDLQDSDLRHLTGLFHVESLSLNQCYNITDRGLRVLQELPDLRALDLGVSSRLYPTDLRSSQITDAVVPSLVGLSRLEELTLSGAGITDNGLARLTVLKNLRFLDLSETRITDASLALFEMEFPNLDTLVLDNTSVTPEAIRRLSQARPSLQIVHPSTQNDSVMPSDPE
jgi:hypothetical protein